MKKKTARVKRVVKLCENQENFEPAELSDSLRALNIPSLQRQLKQLQQVTSSASERLPLQAARNDSTSMCSSRSPRGRRRTWTRLRTTRTPRYRKMGRRRGRTRTRTRPSKLLRRSTSSRKPSVRTYASHSDRATTRVYPVTHALPTVARVGVAREGGRLRPHRSSATTRRRRTQTSRG